MGCNCGRIILVSRYNLHSIRQRRFLAILNKSAKKKTNSGPKWKVQQGVRRKVLIFIIQNIKLMCLNCEKQLPYLKNITLKDIRKQNIIFF